jgi:hypothetical protein
VSKEERKPGYYWARFRGDKTNVIIRFDGTWYFHCGVGFYLSEIDWIDSNPIPEPKPKLIPGKYYVVEFRASKAKDIIQCQNDNMFIAPGSHQRYSFEIVDVLSEGFSPEQVIEKLK